MDARASWPVWGLEASVVVTDPWVLDAASAVVRAVLADVEQACSRFREDSELLRLQPELAVGALASPLLVELVERALDAARWTDGDVDPTLGADLSALGYDRDIVSVRFSPELSPEAPSQRAPRVPGWSRIAVDGPTLTVPADLRLDLGATAKAFAADRAAAMVHSQLGCGVLVGLGGDLASAGPGPVAETGPGTGPESDLGTGPGPDRGPVAGAWQILVQDLPADPSQRVALESGFAMATSSTQKRRWKHAGKDVHHILDPRIGLPAEPVWRSVTVAAPTCLEANAFSTAGIVRGFAAVEWFRFEGIPARLVDREGRVVTTGSWPKERCLIESGASHG